MKSEIKNLAFAADQNTLQGVAITINYLTKSFGGKDVLHDLNLDVKPGEFVTIVGKSGCGKSTLLRLLAGLEQPTSGEISLDGSSSGSAKVQDGVRVMFQDPRLLPWRTVIQNVAIGLEGDKKEISQRAQDVLAHVGLADRANEWPNKLSGGQRQRVALARALIHKPKLLLLDEPLGALDALTRLEMQRLIERLWLEHKFTALLVTHDVSEAVCLGDRAILLENGQITLDETIDLDRPRDHTEHQVAQIEKLVLNRLMTVQAINTRNQIQGVITHISLGPVLSEVHVHTSVGEVISTVLTRSLSEQPLEIGARVLANFKSTEVMLAI